MFTAPMLYGAEITRWQKALTFAIEAHGEQKRKYTGDPYWWHVADVASIVSHVPRRSMEMVEAALLHDTLEDTEVTPATLEANFGPIVVAYVEDLTDPPHSFGNRATRKNAVSLRLTYASWAVKTIKLADVLNNASTLIERDPKWAIECLPEKVSLLAALHGGDPELWAKVASKVTEVQMLALTTNKEQS